MNWEDKDFRSMFFPIHGEDDIWNIPQLSTISHLFKGIRKNRDRIAKYFIYAYDKGSPLIRKLKKIDARKEWAASLAGFDAEKDKKLLEPLYNLEGDMYAAILYGILTEQNYKLWMLIVAYEQSFSENFATILGKTSENRDKDLLQALNHKQKILEKLDQLNDKLEGLYLKFFQNDVVVKDHYQSNNLSPEKIAKMVDV